MGTIVRVAPTGIWGNPVGAVGLAIGFRIWLVRMGGPVADPGGGCGGGCGPGWSPGGEYVEWTVGGCLEGGIDSAGVPVCGEAPTPPIAD